MRKLNNLIALMNPNKPHISHNRDPYHENKPSRRRSKSYQKKSSDNMLGSVARGVINIVNGRSYSEVVQTVLENTCNPQPKSLQKSSKSDKGVACSSLGDGEAHESLKRTRSGMKFARDDHDKEYEDYNKVDPPNKTTSRVQKQSGSTPSDSKKTRKAILPEEKLRELNSSIVNHVSHSSHSYNSSRKTATACSASGLQELKSDLELTTKELEILEDENFALKLQLEEFKEEKSTRFSNMEKRYRSLRDQNKSLNDENEQLKGAHSEVNNKLQSIQKKLNQVEADNIAVVKKHIDQRKKDAENWEQQTSELESKLKASIAREAELAATNQKYSLTIAYTQSRSAFHNEQDDAYFEESFKKVEATVQNWVFTNFRGQKKIPDVILEYFDRKSFMLPISSEAEQDPKEIAFRIRNFVISLIKDHVFDGYHCGMNKELKSAFCLVSSFFTDEHEKCKWEAKTLHHILQSGNYQKQMKEKAVFIAKGIDDTLKPWAAKSSKETSRLKALTKLVELVAEIATESCLLSSSQIALKWPDSSTFNPETMISHDVPVDDMDQTRRELPLRGFIFPMVLKHHFEDDGTRTTGILRKSTALILPDIAVNQPEESTSKSTASTGPIDPAEAMEIDMEETKLPTIQPTIKEFGKDTQEPATPEVNTACKEDLINLKEIPKNSLVAGNSSRANINTGCGGGGVHLSAQHNFQNPPKESAKKVDVDDFVFVGAETDTKNGHSQIAPEHMHQSMYSTAYQAPDSYNDRHGCHYNYGLPPQDKML